MNSNQTMSYLSSTLDSNSLSFNTEANNMSCWNYWQNYYYPHVIRESYPVYINERAKDKGKQAFEIIKILKDKKLVKLQKVSDFIDLMDELIKIL
jgi:hypothetical protein